MQKYKNKKIAIYGMGITGRSAAKILKKLKTKIYCWDDNKKIREKAKKSKFRINKFWLNQNSFDSIVISPGIDINKCKIKKYLKKNANKIITDLDLFFELNKKATVISITGTNGKSTTCKIIEKILKTAGNKVKTVGNIGNPILFSQKIKRKCIFILEVSSYQLQYSKFFKSKHAAILNISPDHLERHGNMKKYIDVKSRIFMGQGRDDYSYINAKKPYSKLIKKIFKKKKLNSKLVLVKKEKSYSFLKQVKNNYLKNLGNIENLAFALTIVKKLKINNKTIIKALNSFKGLPHRQELILSNKNIRCINDSKATSFDASLQSLLNYNKIYWILGGIPKKNDSFYLKYVKKNIIRAYIIGNNITFFKKIINKNIPYIVSKNLNSAVRDIYRDITLDENTNVTILFSPAAASFDQFKNFEERGNHFKKLILTKFKQNKNVYSNQR